MSSLFGVVPVVPQASRIGRRQRPTAGGRALATLVALGAVVPSTGCMFGPENGESLPSTTAVVDFDGIVLGPGMTVEILAAPTMAGPFSGWPGSTTASDTSPAPFSVPTGGGQSAPAYEWSVSTTIPADRWGSVVEADGCAHPVTYVRADTGALSLLTFDAPSDNDPGGLACAFDTVLNGGTVIDVANDCASDDTPIARVDAPLVHVGDVFIDGPAAAAALSCIGIIDGSLQVQLGSTEAVALPRLQRVTGDVQLGLESVAVAPYSAPRCGVAMPVSLQSQTATVDLPALASIDGDLAILQTSSGVLTTAGERIELGLDGLTSVGGDLLVSFDIPAVAPCGLSALPSLAGDLTLAFGGADTGGLFLDVLQHVDGEVSISGAFTTLNLLPSLQAAGALVITDIAQLSPSSMPVLDSVEGLVRLDDVGLFGQQLPALAHAQALELHDTGLPSLSLLGAGSLAIESLSLTDNAILSTLLPAGASPVTLSAAAPLTVTGNPNLGSAQVCAFVAFHQGEGWSGPQDLGGVVCP